MARGDRKEERKMTFGLLLGLRGLLLLNRVCGNLLEMDSMPAKSYDELRLKPSMRMAG